MEERTTILSKYTAELQRVGKSENTIKSYISNINIFLDWIEQTIGEEWKPPVMESDTRKYTSYLTTIQKCSLSTINAKLSSIQSFSDFLHSEYNTPLIKVEKKKGKTDPKVETLKRNQVNKLTRMIEAKGNKLHYAILTTFLYTGIREQELCDLELDDFVLTEKGKKAVLIIRDGKGSKFREVPVPNECRLAIMSYLDARPHRDTNKLFIGNRGTLTASGVYKLISRMGENILGVNVYPHMLRHQCFTEQAKHVRNAQDLKDLSSNAGHSSVELTMKYYINGSKENRERLADSINYTE